MQNPNESRANKTGAEQTAKQDAQAAVDDRSPGRRSLRNYWVRPSIQVRFFMHALGILAISIGIGVTLATIQLASSKDFGYIDQSEMLRKTIFVMSFSLILLGMIALVFTAMFVHRVVGPMVPLERMVDALIAGDLTMRVQLRKKDEFQVLAAKLNHLATSLQAERSGSLAKAPSNSAVR